MSRFNVEMVGELRRGAAVYQFAFATRNHEAPSTSHAENDLREDFDGMLDPEVEIEVEVRRVAVELVPTRGPGLLVPVNGASGSVVQP